MTLLSHWLVGLWPILPVLSWNSIFSFCVHHEEGVYPITISCLHHGTSSNSVTIHWPGYLHHWGVTRRPCHIWSFLHDMVRDPITCSLLFTYWIVLAIWSWCLLTGSNHLICSFRYSRVSAGSRCLPCSGRLSSCAWILGVMPGTFLLLAYYGHWSVYSK